MPAHSRATRTTRTTASTAGLAIAALGLGLILAPGLAAPASAEGVAPSAQVEQTEPTGPTGEAEPPAPVEEAVPARETPVVPAVETADPAPYSVTVVARKCSAYTDVAANWARNDVQETFSDLGPDSPYPGSFPVRPSVEFALASQAGCAPIEGWRFTLGRGIVGGSAADLSVVSNPYDSTSVTTASTPLLAADGTSTGSSIAGAATVVLTESQAARAQDPTRLWIQGGVPSPRAGNEGQLNGRQGSMAFASLRCAVDARNGDNVEWIQFTGGARHVFCFAYYVDTVKSGTIVVRKAAQGGEGTAFSFASNISYGDGGAFTLTGGASISFERAVSIGDERYTVSETAIPEGWRLDAAMCTTSASGQAASAWEVEDGAISIALKAGDTVDCTFTNVRIPTPTPTESGTSTPTPTESGTSTPTPTESGTSTPTPTESGTSAPTPTSTGTPTSTQTSPTAGPTEPSLPDTGAQVDVVAPAGGLLLLLGIGLTLAARIRGRHA